MSHKTKIGTVTSNTSFAMTIFMTTTKASISDTPLIRHTSCFYATHLGTNHIFDTHLVLWNTSYLAYTSSYNFRLYLCNLLRFYTAGPPAHIHLFHSHTDLLQNYHNHHLIQRSYNPKIIFVQSTNFYFGDKFM